MNKYILNIIKSNFNFAFFISIVTFIIWYIALGSSFIFQPYIWDDLHMIRSYSTNEIANSWMGNWDSDQIETPSYRPLAILFYNFLGSVFGENFVFLRFFIFFLMIFILTLFCLVLFEFNFNKLQIVIFSALIVFTKIYSTLLSWFTLSALMFCYLLAIISIYFFIKWLKDNKNLYYLFSIFFCFLSIFTREEMYVLPGVLFLISIYKNKIFFKKLLNNLFYYLPFFGIVILHITLRKLFVPEAANFSFYYWGVTFGGENISFGNLIKAFKASWLPMGYWSTKNILLIQTASFFIWISFIFLALLKLFEIKKSFKINIKKIVIITLILVLLCLPNITIERAFGIFMPTLLTITLISYLISNLLNINYKQISKNFFLNFKSFLAIAILLSGVIGGYDRAKKHIKSTNIFSEYIVLQDSIFIYGFENLKIPEVRYEKKKKHLQNLGIYNKNDYLNLNVSKNTKIKREIFNPLNF